MKYLLIGFLFSMQVWATQAQLPNTFTSQGLAGFAKKNANNTVDSAYRTARLSPEQKKYIKEELAARVQQSINTMEDDSLRWKSLYNNLWTDAERQNIINDLRNFRRYLLSPTPTNHVSGGYTPSSVILDSMLFNAPLYDSIPAQETGTVFIKTSLARTSPLNHFILYWLDSTMRTDNIQSIEIDNNYISGWRQLEKAYKDCKNAVEEIKKKLDSPCIANKDTGNYQRLINSFIRFRSVTNTNPVLQLLRRSFFKKWFWYTGGYLYVNPLAYTTADKRYPVSEKNKMTLLDTFKDEEKTKLPNEKNEDSLLNRLFITRKIRSEKLSLYEKYSTLFKKNIEFKEYKKTDYFYYNAATGYKCLNEKDQRPYKDNRKGMVVVAYNVPAKDTLKISLAKSKTIKNQSAALQAFDAAMDNSSLTTILGNLAGINTAFEKLGPLLNGISPKRGTKIITNTLSVKVEDQSANISSNQEATDNLKKVLAEIDLNQISWSNAEYDLIKSSDSSKKKINNRDKQQVIWEHNLMNTAEETVSTPLKFVINKGKPNEREVPVANEVEIDKISLIKASFMKPQSPVCNTCPPEVSFCIIKSFLNSDYCYDFNYSKEKELEKDAESLLRRFRCYIDSINRQDSIFSTRLDTLQNIYLPLLKSYVSIIQRSLPPVLHYNSTSRLFDEEKTDEMPEFKTVIFEPELPRDSTKEIVYEVTSIMPGKITDGKIPGGPNTVISGSFKYAKRFWIDYSVGLGYITSDYLLKTNTGSNLPEISEGEKFKPIAGLHIYPLGLLKVNDRFAVPDWYTRLSLFAGVGIKKPLENLYPGISYDIVPGIRIIGGLHYYKDTRYTISGGSVIDQASSLKNSGGYIAVNIEPVSFIKLLNLIK